MDFLRRARERLAPQALLVAIAVVLAVDLALVLGGVVALLRQWVFTGAAWWWVDTRWLATHADETWQSAILLAGVLAWAIARPASHHRRARQAWLGLAVVLGVVTIAVVAMRPTLAQMGLPTDDLEARTPLPWDWLVGMGLGIAAAGWLARRPQPRMLRRILRLTPHRVLAAVALAASLQAPSIADFVDRHTPQAFPAFRVELVAAWPQSPNAPDAVWSDGTWWRLQRDDLLVIDDADVERVRWIHDDAADRPGIEIHFDPETSNAMRQRSIRRFGEHDALTIDGRVAMVPRIEGELLQGTLALYVSADDRHMLAELYTRLTGIAAPPE